MSEQDHSSVAQDAPPARRAGSEINRPALDEPVLADDYPIYAGYLYVADGKVIASDFHGVTARELKRRLGATELRRCDIYGRKAAKAADAPSTPVGG